jgi:hypothetical protein
VRKPCCAIFAALVSIALVSGCDSGSDSQPGEVKKTDTTPFKGMLGEQMKNANVKVKMPENAAPKTEK